MEVKTTEDDHVMGAEDGNTNTNWESFRSTVFETMLSCQVPIVQTCLYCHMKCGYVKCVQCCKGRRLCGTCDQMLHENQPFHDRQYIVADGFFQYIQPTESIDDDGNLMNVSMYSALLPIYNPLKGIHLKWTNRNNTCNQIKAASQMCNDFAVHDVFYSITLLYASQLFLVYH